LNYTAFKKISSKTRKGGISGLRKKRSKKGVPGRQRTAEEPGRQNSQAPVTKGGDMMTIEEAIKTAIEYEIRIRDIYLEATAAVDDAVGKGIFETLGQDEQHHIDYLEHKLAQFQKTGVIEPTKLESAVPDQQRINQEADKIKSLAAKDYLGIKKQMLSRALEVEIETSDFYQKMVDELPADARPLFERFLEIENNHIKAVQFELDYLSKTGYWFDFKEFDME
jgi:rubrerythrin